MYHYLETLISYCYNHQWPFSSYIITELSRAVSTISAVTLPYFYLFKVNGGLNFEEQLSNVMFKAARFTDLILGKMIFCNMYFYILIHQVNI